MPPAPHSPRTRADKRVTRDYRLDFWRGLALFLIFIDHIPDNALSWFTLPSVAFSDAAEIFIFISGYAAGLVYGRAFEPPNRVFAVARIYKRVWQLYVAHLFLFMLYNAEVSYIVQRFNNPIYNDELHVADFLETPDIAILNALMLRFQPTFLDILPLYIALLSLFPLVLAGLAWRPLVVLVPSISLYLAVQVWGFNAPGYPADREWFFNPFAWQLLFVLGALFGHAARFGPLAIPRSRHLTTAAAVAVAGFAIVKLSWTLHGINDAVPGLFLETLWPIDKTSLAPIRLANFLAMALLARQLVRTDARWLTSRLAWPFILCGQNSLEVFCWSILLALFAHFIMVDIDDSIPAQLAINLGGFGSMIALAYLLAWFDAGGRWPRRPAPVEATS